MSDKVLEFIKEFEQKNERVVKELLPISEQGIGVVEKMISDYNEPYRKLLEYIYFNSQFFHSSIELDTSLDGEDIKQKIEKLLK